MVVVDGPLVAPWPPEVGKLLELARKHLGMDVALISHVGTTEVTVAAVSVADPSDAVLDGHVVPRAETYCALIADGSLEAVVPDTRAHPVLATMDATERMGICSYVGVPILLEDGSVYGTMCAFSRQQRPDLDEHAADVVGFLAEVVSTHLGAAGRNGTSQGSAAQVVRELIDRDHLTVVFQPIVELATGTVQSVEALARFPGDVPESPGRWLAAARDAGLGVELQSYALRRALATLPALPEAVTLAVNLSGSALCAASCVAALESVDLRRVVLELTEQEDLSDAQAVRCRVQALRERGARVALDDFGAGYSGLTRLVQLRPDQLKLDRGVVDGLAGDRARQDVVRAIVSLAAAQETVVVAEGIESEVDRDALLHLGVAYGQGYLFGRPGPLCAQDLTRPA